MDRKINEEFFSMRNLIRENGEWKVQSIKLLDETF